MFNFGPERLQEIEKKESLSSIGSEGGVTVVHDLNHVDVSGTDEAKLIRKVDWHLLPWLSFLYLLSFLDRTSIANAKVRNFHTFSAFAGS